MGAQALSVKMITIRTNKIFFMVTSKIVSKFRTMFKSIGFHQNEPVDVNRKQNLPHNYH